MKQLFDESILKKELEVNWTLISNQKYQTQELVDFILNKNPEAIVLIPESMISESSALLVVRYNIDYLSFIPEHLQTEEFCLKILTENPKNLYTIFKRLKKQYVSCCRTFLFWYPESYQLVNIVNGSNIQETIDLLNEKEKLSKILAQ